jgi:Cdc6-like AAA superfamily ATPase
MAKKPDAAFIDRATKLGDAYATATWEQVDQLVADAGRYGNDSVEMAYALFTKGRLARWSQQNLGPGAEGLERAIRIAEESNLGPDICSRWARTLSVVWDDLGEAQRAIDAAEKARAVSAPMRGKMTPEAIAASAGLAHTMRLALHPVVPELRALAEIWPSMTESERKVQIEVVKRFIERRRDLSADDIERLKNVTVDPDGVHKVLPPPEPKADPGELAKVLTELDALVGLPAVKAEFRRLASVLQVEEMRRAAGLTVAPRSNHFVFLGPPGTGKTTVARLLGRLFKSLGLLAKGEVVEVDRSTLVAGYIGQTAIKVGEAVDAALDGVLFVDEAYSLFNPSERDFGHEAVATLLKRMEDDRARLVVVLAGYDEPMLRMLQMNPGLKSRINTTLHFRTYNAQELTTIFMQMAEKSGYRPTEAAVQRVREIAGLMKGSEDPATFGNAREIRNLFEDSVAQQAARLVAHAGRGRKPTPEELQRLEPDDIHWEFLGDESLRDTLAGESLRTVSVHEMGHALVGYLVDGPPPVLVTTIPSAHALGRTFFAEEPSPIFTRAQLLGRAARALAGRAAEEVVFGVLTSGAAHDLEIAERIALELLRTGMSEETTHEALEEYAATDDGTGGRAWRNERTRKEVGELLQEAYALALQLLREKEPTLRMAANRLVERRKLSREELAILFGSRPAARGAARSA